MNTIESLSQASIWIAVFGSPTAPDGSATPTQLRRVAVAVQQAQRYPQAPVLVMGAAVANQYVEAETMCAEMHRSGIQEDRLIPERATTTTREQARLLADLARRYNPRTLILVSDASHLPRIRMMMKRAKLRKTTLESAGAPWSPGLSSRLNDLIYEAVAWSKDYCATLRGI